ncbi:hypothetical protein SUGI_0678070 [Cryptomeria japonica]|nr:hypothetical protein SUGI_0678070 [Cryptomeria japonica]
MQDYVNIMSGKQTCGTLSTADGDAWDMDAPRHFGTLDTQCPFKTSLSRNVYERGHSCSLKKTARQDIADGAGIKLAESLSPWATYIHCDVSKEQDKGSVAEIDIQDFEQVMNVNVKGVINGIKHAARVMIPNRKGSIISTASIAGIAGGFTPYAYTASKHAVIGLTKNGAAELGKCGIRVNCISPAAIPTDLVLNYVGVNPSPEAKTKLETAIEVVAPLREANLRPEDIAEAALYLASEDSKYCLESTKVLKRPHHAQAFIIISYEPTGAKTVTDFFSSQLSPLLCSAWYIEYSTTSLAGPTPWLLFPFFGLEIAALSTSAGFEGRAGK